MGAFSEGQAGGLTQHVCAHSGRFQGSGRWVTVVDTPGFGNTLQEEEANIDQLVDFLKDDLRYVNTFILTFKESDKRVTLALQSMIKLLGRMFGDQFWDNALIAATHWGYDARKMAIRNSSGYSEQSWTEQINKLFRGLNPRPPLPSVFIDSFYDVGSSAHATSQFIVNTQQLLEFSTSRQPFECKDIEKAILEIREQEEIMKQLREAKEKLESEKNNLMYAIEVLKQQNYKLEASNANLSMMSSTMSPLQGLSGPGRRWSGHSSSSLLVVAAILFLVGLVAGGGTSAWYHQHCNEMLGGGFDEEKLPGKDGSQEPLHQEIQHQVLHQDQYLMQHQHQEDGALHQEQELHHHYGNQVRLPVEPLHLTKFELANNNLQQVNVVS